MSATIGAEGIEQFRTEGYVFLPDFFDADAIEEFRDETDRILELVVNSSLATGRTSDRLNIAEDDDGHQSVKSVNPSIDLSRVFKRVAIEDLPPLLRPLMKDDPVSIDRTAQLNYKQPLPEPVDGLDTRTSDDRYPVHADWPYYEGRFPEGIITGIVFIDACTDDNGPLEIWPGTHTDDIEHQNTDLGLAVPPDQLDHDAGQKVTGPAGSVLLFDCRLVHSSAPNYTESPRRLAIFGHAPATNVDTEIADGSARPESENGYPIEFIESTYVNEYRRLKRRGQFEDEFTAPET